MRGRWASAAIGAGVARRRAGAQIDQQAQSYEVSTKTSTATNRSTAKTNRSTTTTKTAATGPATT